MDARVRTEEAGRSSSNAPDATSSDARVPDATAASDSGGLREDAGTTAGDDAGADPAVANVLCDGSDALRLIATRTLNGGMLAPGSGVAFENGTSFLLVRGDCRFWVYSGIFQPTRSGELTAAQRDRLIDALRLDRWADYMGDYTRGPAFDYPNQFVAFGVDAIDAPCSASKSGGRGCIRLSSGGTDTTANVAWLEPSLRQQITQLEAEGTPVSGAIRYVLAEQRSNGSSAWSRPAMWPLGDPATVALTEIDAMAYRAGESTLATGADAEALRSIWSRYLSGEVGDRTMYEIIPVVSGSATYHLFVRDSLPLEDARGLLPLFVSP